MSKAKNCNECVSWSPTFILDRTDCLKGHKPRFSTKFEPGTDYIKGFHRRCDDFEKVTLKKLIGNVAKQNRNEMEKEKIELFAVVELFGHNRIAGKVTEHNFGSSTFVRIDVPETPQQPSFTRLVNPTAIYAINPVTEDVMKAMANNIQQKPIEAWDVRVMVDKLIALKSANIEDDL